MSVRIIIERKFRVPLDRENLRTIEDIRIKAMRQKGYVSGETLVNSENKREVAVVSTWSDFEDFNAWLNSRERAELENKLTPYLEVPAKVGCFLLGADAIDEMFEKIVHDSEAAS